MSPNAYVSWCDNSRLLCGYDGESSEPKFKWTYSVFEETAGERVTPSMYEVMADYVSRNITKDQLYEIQADDYYFGDLEKDAVESYYDLPLAERTELHTQMMKNLEAERDLADAKLSAYIDAILDEKCQFDVSSPIYTDYNRWLRTQKEICDRSYYNLNCEFEEESSWIDDPMEE
jgi:hypothetical protein